jgi:hypothetical protein
LDQLQIPISFESRILNFEFEFRVNK